MSKKSDHVHTNECTECIVQDPSVLNNQLPALRCYHCNKALSQFHLDLVKCEKDKLDQYFKSIRVERYCCKMMLIQNYLKK